MDFSVQIQPFPRPFPSLILERIFYFLDWEDRLKLETLSKECLKILRPKRCPLPAQIPMGLCVCWEPESDETLVERKLSFHKQDYLSVSGSNYATLLSAQERLFRQIPITSLDLRSIKQNDDQFLNSIKTQGKKLTKLRIAQSTVAVRNSFWTNLPYLEVLNIHDLLACDAFLFDLMTCGKIKGLTVTKCDITDKCLTALAANRNVHKLRDLCLVGCPSVTTAGVAALALSIAPVQIEQFQPEDSLFLLSRTQRDVYFRSCSIEMGQLYRRLLNNKYDLLPVVIRRKWYSVEPDARIEHIVGFANLNLFLRISRR